MCRVPAKAFSAHPQGQGHQNQEEWHALGKAEKRALDEEIFRSLRIRRFIFIWCHLTICQVGRSLMI